VTDGYAKHRAAAPTGFFEVEAAGLTWLPGATDSRTAAGRPQ